ncbi:hypothetical protein thsrh120_35400 [Rhizobium sp. No.120]
MNGRNPVSTFEAKMVLNSSLYDTGVRKDETALMCAPPAGRHWRIELLYIQ